MDDGNYWMYVYKVAKCPAKERHDWSACPYAHRGERAARRCPQAFNYSAEACPEYSKRGTCSQGESCPMAHSVFESWLHPSRFRTQLCCFGPSCRRRICFFAHNVAQLRAAPTIAGPTLGGPVMRRTQAVIPASVIAPQTTVLANIYNMQQPILQASAAELVPGMPITAPGCMPPTQGWPTPDAGTAAAPTLQPVLAQGIMADASAAAAAASALASQLGSLVLQQDQGLPTPPGQQVRAQVMLQTSGTGGAYVAAPSMGSGMAGSSQHSSMLMRSSEPLDHELCMPTGAGMYQGTNMSASGSLVGYSNNSDSGMAFDPNLQQFQQQQYHMHQTRHGPQGW